MTSNRHAIFGLTIVPMAAPPVPVTPIRMSVIAISARSPIVAWCVVARSIKDRNRERNGEKEPPSLRLLLAEQRYGKHNGQHNEKLFHIIRVVDVRSVYRLRPANVLRGQSRCEPLRNMHIRRARTTSYSPGIEA